MAGRQHRYRVDVRWTGSQGQGTAGYRSYSRDHEIASPVPGKPVIPGSSDPAFRGDQSRWNPEELFVAAISACHKLWYLHLCAAAGVVVTGYLDQAEGIMAEGGDGGGRFVSVTLRPQITLMRTADVHRARDLHHEAHAKCFIANSIDTPITVEPAISAADAPAR